MARQTRKKPVAKCMPKAKPPRLLDVTGMRRDIDYEHLRDRVDLIEGHVSDHTKRIEAIAGTADYWAGLSQHVKTLEDERATPSTTIVEQASGMSIALCFLIHDLVAGAVIGAAWWYWSAFGMHLPPFVQ